MSGGRAGIGDYAGATVQGVWQGSVNPIGTYVSTGTSAAGAGLGYAVGGRQGALVGMQLGDFAGDFVGSGLRAGLEKGAGRTQALRAMGIDLAAATGGAAGAYLSGGDFEAILHGAMQAQQIVGMMQAGRSLLARACFAAGTHLRTPDGSKPIEQFRVGDQLLSRDEYNADGPIEVKTVEEVFVRFGRVLHLHVGGQVIGTTAEHPFYVRDKGWLPAGELVPGDLLSSHDSRWIPVEEVFDTGETATVYNLRIADFHTYFVGGDEWGFSVWAHNAYTTEYEQLSKGFNKKFRHGLAELADSPTHENWYRFQAEWAKKGMSPEQIRNLWWAASGHDLHSWQSAQAAAGKIVRTNSEEILKFFPAPGEVEIGYRGSLATGYKFDKASRQLGRPFSSREFDVDAYFAHDQLARLLDPVARDGFRDLRSLRQLDLSRSQTAQTFADHAISYSDVINSQLRTFFPGNTKRSDFTFRVYTMAELQSFSSQRVTLLRRP